MSTLRRTLAVSAAVLGGGAALAGSWSAAPSSQLAREIDAGQDHISAVETAELLMHGGSGMHLFDLRSKSEFQHVHIPGAIRTTLADLVEAKLSHDSLIVLYSAGGAHAAQAWTLLRLQGYRKVFFLREGVYEWMATVEEPQLASDATPAERTQFQRAKVLSAFFGGSASVDVPRSELRQGYWTGASNDGEVSAAVSSGITTRRRGC